MTTTKSNMKDFLQEFINPSQLSVMMSNCRGEESEFGKQKLQEMYDLIQDMPKTYEQDGKGAEAIAYLHYFNSSYDFYITEKDMGDEQIQAFGIANMEESELGYINIKELLSQNCELDLYWTLKSLRNIFAQLEVQ